MRITCPQCQAGYDVDPGKIPPAGLKVRCPQCERVFAVRPEPCTYGPTPSAEAILAPTIRPSA